VRANREYELIVTRGGLAPAVIADPDRVDHIEVLEIATNEVVLFWDLYPNQTGRMSRALKTDLAQMEGDEFIAKWSRYDDGAA
jgi:hypothetical protein